jgi:pyroglutamyl-peptidase
MPATRVLVTGFEPFGGETVNPALEVVKRLQGRVLTSQAGSIEIVTWQIPTVFGKSVATLTEAIDAEKPDVVICVGQAGGRHHITPERVAINVDDARIPDNDGNQPIDTPIVENGPVAYWTKLPIKRIVQALQADGIPASVSNTAGTYVCNHIFYSLMHLLNTKYPEVTGGFVHIPFLPEQVVDKPMPSVSLQTIVRGMEIIITTAVETDSDAKITGGTEC